MKLQYKHTEKGVNRSLYVSREEKPYLESNWHFHEEFELTMVPKGSGLGIEVREELIDAYRINLLKLYQLNCKLTRDA